MNSGSGACEARSAAISRRASRRRKDRHHLDVFEAEAMHSEGRLAASASVSNGFCRLAMRHARRIAAGLVIPPKFA